MRYEIRDEERIIISSSSSSSPSSILHSFAVCKSRQKGCVDLSQPTVSHNFHLSLSLYLHRVWVKGDSRIRVTVRV